MNRIILHFLILVLSGCVAGGSLPRLTEKPEKSLVDGKGDFIELFNGQIIEGSIAESGNKGLIISGRTYHVKEIKSYQYKSEYRTTIKNRFVTRVTKGKINVYKQVIIYAGNMYGSSSSSRAGGSGTFYYIQKGDSGKMEFFEVKKLSEMVKDNPKALEWINKYKKQKRKNDSYLDYAIEEYNS